MEINESGDAPDFEKEPARGESDENPFVNGDRPFVPTPERHGCVSAWLILGLIGNFIVGLVYFVVANKPIHLPKVSVLTAYCIIIVSVLNIIFAIKLLRWKKIGFYGFCVTAIFTLLINIDIGINPVIAILGLPGIGLFYAVLQIKKGGISAWRYLK